MDACLLRGVGADDLGGPADGVRHIGADLRRAFGLVVSPVSWSHHWAWALPTVLVSVVLAYRLRNVALVLTLPRAHR